MQELSKTLHVVAGVIYNSQGQILLAQRLPTSHQAGLWEFPGGKRKLHETSEQALARELYEEINIQVEQARPLIRIYHNYPDKYILLDVWRIEQWHGRAYGKEDQLIEWCYLSEFKNKIFPNANYPIITALQLPVCYLITPEPRGINDKKFFYQLEKCLEKQISLIQLRAYQLDEREYCYCAEKALNLCERYAAKLLVNATPEIALSVGASGVHLNSQRLSTLSERPLAKNLYVSASCHTLHEILQANAIEIDFAVVSAVRPTQSHPTVKSLGWQQFFQFSEQANFPVFALGGMQMSDIPWAWAHGGQGIAAISHLWNNLLLPK